ncbi:hypothetical protein ACLD0I_14675, partial [Acinetobacter baumannii]
GIRSTTYPSYALNLAQLGALCISNLCATKPISIIDGIIIDGTIDKDLIDPSKKWQYIEYLIKTENP